MDCLHSEDGMCRHPELPLVALTRELCSQCPKYMPPAAQAVSVPPCVHLGSKRRCCEELYICRKLGTDCILSGSAQLPVVSCGTCGHWEPVEKTAPLRSRSFTEKPWTGAWRKKPWDFQVAVAIPVLDSPESCRAIVELMRCQTERPFVMLIDTGSSPESLVELQNLRAEDVEVHSLAFSGMKHPSDFPAVAMDLAFSACRSPYLLATHADCFLRSRHVVADLLESCRAGNPVVGYEITERPHSDWQGMVGHTLTMFDMKEMDRINASWSMRRLVSNVGHPDGMAAVHEISPATTPNWPDTELLINYQCRDAGIVPLIIGKERNAERTVDDRIDHCRSWASAHLYASGSDYATASNGWLADGIKQAWVRVEEWKSSQTAMDVAARSV